MKVKIGSVLKKISNYLLVPRWMPRGRLFQANQKRNSLENNLEVEFEEDSPRPYSHSNVVNVKNNPKEIKFPGNYGFGDDSPLPISPFQSRYLRQRAIERRKSLSNLDISISEKIRFTNQVKIERDNDGWKYVNDYKVVKILGYGSQGDVRLVEKNFESYAMKTIHRSMLRSGRKDLKLKSGGLGQFENELRNLHRINHANCINLLEVLNDDRLEKVYLIFEYAAKGPLGRINPETGKVFRKHEELEYLRSTSPILDPENSSLPVWNPFESVIETTEEPTLLSSTGEILPVPNDRKSVSSPPPPPLPHDDDLPLNERRCRRLFYDLIVSIRYLHKNGICHRDLKPSNLLITEDDHLKVSDFGDSFFFGEDGEYGDRTKERRGCPHFAPPEYTYPDRRLVSTKAHDCWSLGCCLFVMVFGELPFFDDNSILGLYEKIQTVDIKDRIDELLYPSRSRNKKKKKESSSDKKQMKQQKVKEENEGEEEEESIEVIIGSDDEVVKSPFMYFRDPNNLMMMMMLNNNNYSNNRQQKQGKKISRSCVNLLIRLLEKDPLKRLSIEEVWVSDFIKQERILRKLNKRRMKNGHRRTKTMSISSFMQDQEKLEQQAETSISLKNNNHNVRKKKEKKKKKKILKKSKSCSFLTDQEKRSMSIFSSSKNIIPVQEELKTK